MRKYLKILAVIAVIVALTAVLFGCDDGTPEGYDEEKLPVDYTVENAYEVREYSFKDVYFYEPIGADCEYGVIFYLGTIISAENYAYIGRTLASQGYLVCLPDSLFAYINYSTTEKQTAAIHDTYPDTKFFIGGHSQGGGAAIKAVNENPDKYLGAILCSPLCYEKDTIEDLAFPAILFEAENDTVLNASQQEQGMGCLNPATTEYVFIEGGNHMGYCDMTIMDIIDGDCEIGIAQQQALVAEKALAFIRANL